MTTGHHHPHDARRSLHSHVDVPARKTDRHQKKMAMLIGVGATMVVILALYAASFRHNILFLEARQDAPRWSTIDGAIVQGSAPYEAQLNGLAAIKNAVVSMVKAKSLQSRSIDIMKEKIQSASATAATKN